MTQHAITVLGHDRPGIIAETTGRLAGLGLNLEDSSMTLLRRHFAMTLVCEGDVADLDIEVGGHATCFTAGATSNPFQPLSASLLRYHRQLKAALDPQGIFNPGRMYSEV